MITIHLTLSLINFMSKGFLLIAADLFCFQLLFKLLVLLYFQSFNIQIS